MLNALLKSAQSFLTVQSKTASFPRVMSKEDTMKLTFLLLISHQVRALILHSPINRRLFINPNNKDANYYVATKTKTQLFQTQQENDDEPKSILDNILQFRKNFSIAANEGFGTKARNVASTMSVGDIVVPLCGNLAMRQILANQGIYPGVEYKVCTLQVNGQDIKTIEGLSNNEKRSVVATMKPAYKLRDYLERSDWPVSVKPLEDVPLWLSKATYEAGTMVGTLGLSLTYLSMAAFLAFFVRFTFVPSESMIPALNPGDVTIVTRTIPIGPLKPNVGDVILFDPPSELNEMIAKMDVKDDEILNKPQQGEQFLKRVVATPGEVVGVKNAQPFVALKDTNDGKRQFRVDIVGPYSRPEAFPASSWDRPAEVPLGRREYFVAGDNGFRSVDSRVWGPLKQKYIFGKAQWIIWPLEDFGPVKSGQISTITK